MPLLHRFLVKVVGAREQQCIDQSERFSEITCEIWVRIEFNRGQDKENEETKVGIFSYDVLIYIVHD